MVRTRPGTPRGEATSPPASTVAGGLLSLHLLGGFDVAVGDRAVPDGSWRVQKARSLVKLLALAPGHRLGREQIADLLWPDLDPGAAINNFHRTLHAARRALDPDGTLGVLPLRQGILTLAAPSGLSVDVADFELAAARARSARSLPAYRDALERYSGELLPEDRYEDWAAPRREALHQSYLGLLMDVARLYADIGDVSSELETLNRALMHDPALEEAHAALMRAYARAGRRGEALRQYARLRETLQRELDTQPEPATRALYGAILARSFPQETPAPNSPAAASPSAGPHNLPAPTSSFIGRRQEVPAVVAALATTRLLTLAGPPGSGKTRLALAVAERALPSYPDGIWLVELAPLADPGGLPGAVAAALGVRERPGQQPGAVLNAHLGTRTLLLVLDNCEHLTGSCAEFAAALLATCPGLRILATSREALRAPGEVVWRVPPLTLPPLAASDAATVAASEAVQLLVERARQQQPGFVLGPDNAAAVAAICRRLDGLPLALELAAVRLTLLTVEQLAARLGDALDVLGTSGHGSPSRQRTIRATLAWSYGLLGSDESTLLCRTGVFAGGWTLEAAELICSGTGLAKAAILELLAHLVDRSLVVAEPQAAGTRYRLLEVVRQFAREKLEASGAASALQERHAAYFLALAEEAAPHLVTGDQAQWLDRLEADHGNLRAALAWAQEGVHAGDARRVTQGAALGAALAPFWLVRGYLREGRERLERLLHERGLLAGASRAAVLTACGMLASNEGDRAGAVEHLEASIALWRAAGDSRGLATALRHLASILIPQGHLAGAQALLEESLALCRDSGDRHGEALTGGLLARIMLVSGDYAAVEARCEASLVLLHEFDDVWNGAVVMTTLGTAALYRGDLGAAQQVFTEGLARYRQVDSAWGVADTLSLLGWCALFLGDVPGAIAACEESAAICQIIGDHGIEAAALTTHGLARLFSGDDGRAGQLLADALALWRNQENGEFVGYCLVGLAGVAGLRGQGERAATLLGAAEAHRERIGIAMRPVAGATYGRIVDLARDGLDESAFAANWARGRALDPGDAITQALAVGRLLYRRTTTP